MMNQANEAPDDLDAVVAADPAFAAAKGKFRQAIIDLLAVAPNDEIRQLSLTAEEAAHAAIASATDAGWSIGRETRLRANAES